MLYMRSISAALLVINVAGLNNGLARIPDRGWNSVRVCVLGAILPLSTHPLTRLAAV